MADAFALVNVVLPVDEPKSARSLVVNVWSAVQVSAAPRPPSVVEAGTVEPLMLEMALKVEVYEGYADAPLLMNTCPAVPDAIPVTATPLAQPAI